MELNDVGYKPTNRYNFICSIKSFFSSRFVLFCCLPANKFPPFFTIFHCTAQCLHNWGAFPSARNVLGWQDTKTKTKQKKCQMTNTSPTNFRIRLRFLARQTQQLEKMTKQQKWGKFPGTETAAHYIQNSACLLLSSM